MLTSSAFARGERELFLRKIYLQNFIPEVEDYLRRDFEQSQVELKMSVGYTGSVRIDENKMKRQDSRTASYYIFLYAWPRGRSTQRCIFL